jgi:pimeloyl-ACP methyl ester carboxylesterase
MKKIGFRSMAALLAITVFFSAAFGVTGANDSVTATVLTPTAHIDANASSAGGDDIVARADKTDWHTVYRRVNRLHGRGGLLPADCSARITHSTTYLLDENGNHALDKDGNEIKSGSFILDRTTLVPDIVKQLAFPMAKMLITQRDNGFTDAVYNAAKSAVWIQATNPDGTTANNLEVKKYETSYAGLPREEVEWLHINVPLQSVTEVIGEDLVYFFTFSIVGDAMLAAQELDEFIQKIKNETGKDKVNLLGISMGGTIFTAYAEQYREKGDISQVINVVSVLNGTKLVGDIYALNLDFSDEMLYKEFLPIVMEDATGSRAWGYLANLIIRIIPKDILTGFIEAAITGVIDQMLRCAPQFWALIPREDYPALAERWLSGEEYAYMRSRTDAFYQAQMNLEDNMRYMVEQQGVAINNFCGYNLRFGTIMGALDILGSSLTSNGDSVVTVESASMGATAAPAGTQLPESYLNAHSAAAVISPGQGVGCVHLRVAEEHLVFFYNQETKPPGTTPRA